MIGAFQDPPLTLFGSKFHITEKPQRLLDRHAERIKQEAKGQSPFLSVFLPILANRALPSKITDCAQFCRGFVLSAPPRCVAGRRAAVFRPAVSASRLLILRPCISEPTAVSLNGKAAAQRTRVLATPLQSIFSSCLLCARTHPHSHIHTHHHNALFRSDA